MNDFNKTPPVKPHVHGLAGYTDKKLDDEVWAVWENTDFPADAVLTEVALAPFRGEKPVLTWRQGRLWLLEDQVNQGESADDAIARIALAQAGIQESKARHLGHLRCRATVHSKLQPAGTITYRVLYGVEVGSVADFPADETFERRIVLQRDMNQMLRSYYAAYRREYVESIDDFILDLHKAMAKAKSD